MKTRVQTKHIRYIITLVVLAIVLTCQVDRVTAQGDGPRFYWKGLCGTNAIPVIASSEGGNANPMDPSHMVI